MDPYRLGHNGINLFAGAVRFSRKKAYTLAEAMLSVLSHPVYSEDVLPNLVLIIQQKTYFFL